MFDRIRRRFRSGRLLGEAPTTEPAASGATSRRVSNSSSVILWFGCLTIILGIIALSTVEITSRYVTAIADAERVSQSIADVLAEHTARTFEAVERTLQTAASIRNDVVSGRITVEKGSDELRTLQKTAPALLAIAWTNELGDVVAHSFSTAPTRSNIADLQQFIVQRNSPDAGLFIAPLYRSGLSNQWISSASIRLNHPDGSFAGAVTAPIDLRYFTNIYRSINLGVNDSVTLMLRDGTILTREPLPADAGDRSYSNATLFTRLVNEANFGVFNSLSPIDGVERIAAYRLITGLPLVMIVSQDRSEVLNQWFGHLRSFVPMVALLVIVVLAGGATLARRTRQLTRESALLEATLENMHQGLIVVDESDRIAIYNKRVLDLLNLPEAFLAARPLSAELIAFQAQSGEFDDISASIKPFIKPRVTGEIENVYERTRPNGTSLEIRTVPFANGGVVRTYKDITDWKQIERELGERERQFRLLAENATDIIARLTFDGVLLYISPSCESSLGYAARELLGQRVTDYMAPDDIKPTVLQFAAIRQRKSVAARPIEYRFKHKLGHWIWLEANPKLVLDDNGNPLEFVDVVREITDRKIIEADSLLARQQAEHAAQVQAQFLATMSHELRTPLNSIIGFAGLVLDRNDLAADVRRQIGLIQTASDTLLTVVNDVLDFSKIQEGKLDLTATVFDVRQLIGDVLEIVRGSADAKCLALTMSVDDRVNQNLIGDDQRIRQVLLNFLNNAIKFTPAGRVTLQVSAVSQTDGSDTVRFSVSDTGIGIPHNKLERLFQRFSQVDGSTSREYGGSGLGLAICKRLVEMMGGTIGVDTVAGQGSTFWAVLTLGTAPGTASGPVRPDVFETRFPAARLLLVEDVEVNREIATAVLQAMGYRIDTAVDGLEAISAVENGHYDLVLMDIQMPGMDGLTATAHIRALPGAVAAVPIIAMTANVLPAQIAQFADAGMNGHIGKPFRRWDAGLAIDTCLSQARLARASAEISTTNCAVMDQDAIATLTNLLGDAKIDRLLAGLAKQLKDFIAVDARRAAPSDMSIYAHRLVASAGMLGFSEVSERCSHFEQRMSGSTDHNTSFDDVRDACAVALKEIDSRFDRTGS